ncbi:hypothetical protein [Pseudomonas aeruginosa]|uniref:hypothetical protein n=1 Tax=Pseudomonas aeruginosa TaxID=287 RepID=UPI0021F24183|nr:hypothetical protein [Pseudomonas aeruginosa]MCV6454901.1 hypothetical protein [Pseudomonas aeruginosa]
MTTKPFDENVTMMKELLRRLLVKKQPAPTVFCGAATPDPMTDAQLREWALRLHAKSVDPAKLSGLGIDPAMLLKAQLDDQALAEVRRWSGIPQPTRNV